MFYFYAGGRQVVSVLRAGYGLQHWFISGLNRFRCGLSGVEDAGIG